MSLGFLALLLLSSAVSSARASFAGGDDMQRFVYARCYAGKYPANSQYAYTIVSLLSTLANSAGFSLYKSSVSSLSAGSSPAYGLYQCRADISVADCDTCVSSAISRLSLACPAAVSAAVQLHGCLVHYANDSFFGRAAKDVMYKSCGQPAPADVMALRESMFYALNAGGGLHRVGTTGYVNGSAQCVGDQTANGCGECVAAAVDVLRNTCGGADGGEAYLLTCYAEFWSMGQHYYNYNNPPPPDQNKHASQLGRNIAILIGIVAAILFIIMYIQHLRKRAEEEGKC